MGGVGKTTLTQLIYSDGILQFDLKAWVSIGEDFDGYRVSETILKEEGGGDAKDFSSVQEKLKEKLFGKKFLISLDDVWTEDYEKWTCFRAPFVFGAPGSTLIVTSRSREVARIMGTVHAHALEELFFTDCLSVFAQHALGAKNFDQHLDLEEMGKEIVRRCKGLPLAAKALGGLLRGKPNTTEWQNVLKSEI
ncbi:putative disease resistance protein RGA4 [Jatropha curcas]|uniref:putative disease resistance protein RGA4 n=1 Tax=Jatropha curcas TaxID=180498 RepID=UPI0009D79A36|nr:putative disease resistance protein RGA4 [Jatropha curcas]